MDKMVFSCFDVHSKNFGRLTEYKLFWLFLKVFKEELHAYLIEKGVFSYPDSVHLMELSFLINFKYKYLVLGLFIHYQILSTNN
jgi:hypothetical protein